VATVSDNDPKAGLQETPAKATRGRRVVGHVEPTSEQIAAEAAAIYPDTFDSAPTPEEIAAEAYAIYQERGGDHGRHQEDWHEAERRLNERRKG
jgi:hypothetical protein